MKRIVYCLAIVHFLLQPLSGRAQEEFIEPPSKFITSIPFISSQEVLLLCRQNWIISLTHSILSLDTGSSGISLDSTTADYLKLKPSPSNRTIRGIAGIRNVSFLYNRSLRLPGLSIDSLNFHINDYSILTTVYGEKN